MNKRNQFQLQLLSNKLAEYTTKLDNLKAKQLELFNSIKSTPTQHTPEDANRLDLLEQKKILEARIQECKNDLSNSRSEYTQLNHHIKLLPGQLETNKKQEFVIYQEEIQNIKGRTQEANQDYLDKLASLEVDKLNLSIQIQDLQNQLTESQNNLSSIQEHAHSYRKNTILELQQKKQDKIAIINTLDELNKTKEFYNTNSIDVSTLLDSLIELKTQVINSYYANPDANPNANQHNILQIPNARELLPAALFDSNIDTNTNTSMDTHSGELLNAVISYLDKQIQDTKYQLSSICKKATRLDKTITATANNLKTKQDTSSTSREKVVSYKDNYKNAKLIKTSLEERLNNLQARLNSWDVEVIDNVKHEYKMKLDSLAADTLRAQERLNIMTSRIISEHEADIITLAGKIKQVENEIAETNNLLKQTNQELAILLEDIAKNNSTKIELDKINTQIANVELAIAKIQMDIASLSI
jgi:chromosome segregation ATPase